MTHDRQAGMNPADAAAIDWLMRQRDPAFNAWEAFTDWLERDPAHATAYHQLAALDADLDTLPARPEDIWPEGAAVARDGGRAAPATPSMPRRFSRRLWVGGALAASIAGMVGIGLFQASSDSYRVKTPLGRSQVVTLVDGSEIAVNGGSSVKLSRSDPRRIELEEGQVLVSVVHKDAAPFRVSVGGAELVDVGTVFDVARNDGRISVAVSEGAVVYNPRGAAIRVDAGYRFTVRDDGSATDLSAVSPAAVGGWRAGQLVYDGVHLDDVAAEVARTTGIALRTTPAAAGIRFRGALRTDLPEERLVNDLAALSGTSATKESGGWTLSR
ncbi:MULTISPECIES: FecR family protein [Sphingobium]|uniref:FecR family protein n=1 Tax=Sphingobium TaxID=165695 RepID=UPI0015EC9E28|nr:MULTISPECIES: FecR domain-containing protein [Sphingobium]MCW2364083.1 transmembrane sensor [Sphingobium sp. B10D3B]MCW2402520.1 transmembrane sensor [Sphingobium sp. B10D7B]MCW2409499.1 transmembrane sensor [Sphingobium xanthum]